MSLRVPFSTIPSDRHFSYPSSRASSRPQHFSILNSPDSLNNSRRPSIAYRPARVPPNMSGFLSSEAERALMGEEEEARRLFYSDPLNYPPPPGHPAYQGQHSIPVVSSQGWPPSDGPGPSNPQMGERSLSSARPFPYATGEYSSNSWSSLHPDDIDDTSSQVSRASSPGNPADLQNFGYSLGDGMSWRCAYPGCSSQAIFTRGCDLRKHYRRHAKTLFCRVAGCTAEGGFSSRKDRDRHEASHRPEIPCEWRGCGRMFSRVDNMRDHVRRIHQNRS